MTSVKEPSVTTSSDLESILIQNFDWIELFNLGLFITDKSWKLIRWNPMFLQMQDIEPDSKLSGQDIFQIMGLKDYRPVISDKETKTFSFTKPNTGTALCLKLTMLQKDKGTYGLGMLTNHRLDVHGSGWFTHLQYELIKNQQIHLLEQRLEGLIHNINSPLNTIIGYVQILLRENPNSNALKKIMESGFQIDASLKGVMDKIEGSKSRFVQKLDVNKVIKNELEIAKNNLFFKHNVNVQLYLPDKLPMIDMVYSDLSYCLDAILWNAIEALSDTENKDIVIATQISEENLQIKIRDTGSGIYPKDMPFIYELGFTTKKENNSEHLGFGLSFTRQIIQDYKGSLIITSDSNDGTTVIINLPVEDVS
jgi:signal transduction histidine kinase